MNTAMLSLAASLIEEQRPFAVATVVRREAPSSARLGDTAIVTKDGRLHGFIGGSCTRATVVEQALAVLARGEARLISFRDEDRLRADDIVSVPMTCHSGGSVEIYIDPVFPVPRLLLLGSSPVNHALAGLGKAMGFSVDVGIEEGYVEKGYGARDAGVKLFVLVATMGESDEDMLSAAIKARPDYLGVIASRRRMEEIRHTLILRGETDDAVGAIHGPAGLDLGATRPEEIAISVLAQIVASEHTGHTEPGDAHPGHGTAVDPVCGMTVSADLSKPHAPHGETTYYFCCSGCRDRFVASPEQYVAAPLEAATDRGDGT